MADLGAAGARNAVMLSSGFAETGQQGAESQQKLAALARRYNISLLGPNCLGFVNFLDDVPLWTGSLRSPTDPGPIAVISQSGATAGFEGNKDRSKAGSATSANCTLEPAVGLAGSISLKIPPD